MFLFMYIIVVNMSCNSCNKKKKKQIIEQPIIEKSITDYMKEIYDIYDDNNFTFTDFELMADNLSNQPNNSEVSFIFFTLFFIKSFSIIISFNEKTSLMNDSEIIKTKKDFAIKSIVCSLEQFSKLIYIYYG